MSSVLLQTKLFRPHPKTQLVSRPHLLQKLGLILERKLTLISAPAGFGKTTLLGDWLQYQTQVSAAMPVGWLALDSHDNDPARFIAYFIAALKNVSPELGSVAQEMLKAAQPGSVEEIWELLISDIQSTPTPFVLVLDDFHAIETPLIHRCLAFLLEQMPSSMHLVIISRADPPLPLARLRMQEDLLELRALDLRFSPNEIASFFELWIGMKLSREDQDALEERTEGWVAGMQLAAIAMRGVLQSALPDSQAISLSSFIHRISGSTKFILDYLMEEVLYSQPEEIRGFLIRTCVLERLTAPLCDAMIGVPGSQVILDTLEKNNLFLFPLDDERHWYRYHHLFADLLYNSLRITQPALVPELHRKASAWYESQGFFSEAITHALKIPDLEAAADLIEKVALDFLLRGEVNTLLNWSDLVPEDQIRQRPLLCVCFAWVSIVTGNLLSAERYLNLARQNPAVPESSSPGLDGQLDAIDAMVACVKSNYEDSFQLANQALKQLPEQQAYLKGVLAFTAATASEMIGQAETASQVYQEAIQMGHTSGNRLIELFALRNLGDFQMREGKLRQAGHSFQQAIALGTIRPEHILPISALPLFGLGHVYYEWNQLAEAEKYFLQGRELAQRLSDPFGLLSNLQFLARIRFLRGERENACQLWQETEQIASHQPFGPVNLTRMALLQVRLCLLLHEPQAALHWAQIYARDFETGYAYPDEMIAMIWAHIWIAQHEPARVTRLVDKVLPDARSSGRWGVVIKLLILKAHALFDEHQLPAAMAALEEAIMLAKPEGYCRGFLDEGESLEKLLRLAYRKKESEHREYIARLLETLSNEQNTLLQNSSNRSPVNAQYTHSFLVEPLSERELEILKMISAGCSNKEISDTLFITLGTVKAHVTNIYGKLDVRSRTQAIVRAAELKLF